MLNLPVHTRSEASMIRAVCNSISPRTPPNGYSIVDPLSDWPILEVAVGFSPFCGLLGSVAGILIALKYVKTKRRPGIFCQSCGYNLYGLTEPRCPECGTPFDQELLADRNDPSTQDREA